MNNTIKFRRYNPFPLDSKAMPEGYITLRALKGEWPDPYEDD